VHIGRRRSSSSSSRRHGEQTMVVADILEYGRRSEVGVIR